MASRVAGRAGVALFVGLSFLATGCVPAPAEGTREADPPVSAGPSDTPQAGDAPNLCEAVPRAAVELALGGGAEGAATGSIPAGGLECQYATDAGATMEITLARRMYEDWLVAASAAGFDEPIAGVGEYAFRGPPEDGSNRTRLAVWAHGHEILIAFTSRASSATVLEAAGAIANRVLAQTGSLDP